jgi:hypothetical protein
MNRLVRANPLSHIIRRSNTQETKPGGGLFPLAVVAATVGGVWLYRNQAEIPKPKAEEWKNYLPIKGRIFNR